MNVKKNISDALEIDHVPVVVEKKQQEIIPHTSDETNELNDSDEDYLLVRSTLRNLITKGNSAIDEITGIAAREESARGFEVVANLIKTVTETSKDLYNLQKTKRELKEPLGKKLDETNTPVSSAVFVGSTADLLRMIKNEEKEIKTIDVEKNDVI